MQNFNYCFFVPGVPQGKQRVRIPRKGGKPYTPEKTVKWEKHIADCYKKEFPDRKPLPADVPVCLLIQALIPIPKSTPKYKQLQMLNNEIFPTKKPDVDNITKSVMDALNGVAYTDDKQVVATLDAKYYTIPDLCGIRIHILDTNTVASWDVMMFQK